MRQGTIGYMLTPERERMLEEVAERLHIDLEDHGAVHRVIDFALQSVVSELVTLAVTQMYSKQKFWNREEVT